MATNNRKKAAAARAAAQQDPDELVAALETERAGYVRRGLDERVKQVDKVLTAAARRQTRATRSAGSQPAGAATGESQEQQGPRGSAKLPVAGDLKPAGEAAGDGPAAGEQTPDSGKSQD